VAALRERLAALLPADAGARDLLRQLPVAEVRPELRQRFLVDVLRIRGRRHWRPLPWAMGAAAVVAAVALVSLRSPAPVSRDLASGDEPVNVDPAPGVHLRVQGRGAVSGHERDLRVAWQQGALDVDVEPGAGIAFQVETPEGTFRVVGTRFVVTRDLLGSSVAVARGQVGVACTGEGEDVVGAGATRTCLPTTPSGLLARARELVLRGESAVDVMATLDRFFATGSEEGLEEAERIAARIALAEGGPGCASARPYFDALREEDLSASQWLALSRCVGPEEPARGLEAIERALRRSEAEAAAERSRFESLVERVERAAKAEQGQRAGGAAE
jgi:hypothetical protein